MQGRGVACVRFTICIRAGQVGKRQGVNGLLQILGPQKNGGPVQPHGPHAPWARARKGPGKEIYTVTILSDMCMYRPAAAADVVDRLAGRAGRGARAKGSRRHDRSHGVAWQVIRQ